MHALTCHAASFDETGKIEDGAGSLKEGNEYPDEQFQQKDPGEIFIAQRTDQKAGKSQQVVTCYQHAGKTGHRQREHSISGKKSQQDRNTGWYQRQWAEIYRGFHLAVIRSESCRIRTQTKAGLHFSFAEECFNAGRRMESRSPDRVGWHPAR